MGTANHVRGTYYVYCIYCLSWKPQIPWGLLRRFCFCLHIVFGGPLIEWSNGPSGPPFQGLPVHKLTLFSKLFNKSIRLPTSLLQYYVL